MLTIFSIATLATALTAQATLPEIPTTGSATHKLIPVPVETYYTPMGFDDNDNAQIILAGEFANSCQSIGPVQSRVDRDNKVVYLYPTAYEYKGMCLQVKVPFMRVVDLGLLAQGTYRIVNMQSRTTVKEVLTVHEAKNPRVDNFIYAPVQTIFLKNDEEGNRKELILQVTFTNRCMKFGDEPTPVRMTKPGILEVLPIIQVKMDPDCQDAILPYFHTVMIPDANPDGTRIPNGRYLIHVRSMNGSAINKIDYIQRKIEN